MRYAIIRDGVVENIAEWDGEAAWSPPPGTTAELAEQVTVGIGWQWNDGQPIDPNPPTPAAEPAAAEARALMERRAAELLESPDLADQVQGLKLQLQLLRAG